MRRTGAAGGRVLAVVTVSCAGLLGMGMAPPGAAASTVPHDAVVASAGDVDDRCVIQLTHATFLGRPATADEEQLWSALLEGGAPPSQLPEALATSDEWLTVVVTDLYRQALDRDPDAAGLSHWIDQLRRGALVNRVASLIYGSAEHFARAGGTTAGFVADIYRRILHRLPDASGRAYWEARVATLGRGAVAAAFFGSVESRGDRVDALYDQILGRPSDLAGLTYWIERLTTVNDVRLAVLLASSQELRTTACRRTERDAFIAASTVRAHRTVLGRDATARERSDWADRLRTQPYVPWLVASLMDTDEHRSGLAALDTDDFLTRAYANAGAGAPTAEVRDRWAADLAAGSHSRLDVLVSLVETIGPPLVAPDQPVPCGQFTGGGSIVPDCRAGTAGTTVDAVFVGVPGTVTLVNVAGFSRMWAFLDAARRAGHRVDANGPYGSARTREQQEHLFTHGYPANPPGTSMHEWGLALDVACDGLSWSQIGPECRQWVIENAETYGFRVHVEEAWHYSSNGRLGTTKDLSLTPA